MLKLKFFEVKRSYSSNLLAQMTLSTILKNLWILILKVLSRTIFLFKPYKVNSLSVFASLIHLDEMLSEKYQKNKENLNLNQNKLPFSCYSYSIKPSAFMRNYNQKPQNFKFFLNIQAIKIILLSFWKEDSAMAKIILQNTPKKFAIISQSITYEEDVQ